jgi:two-component system, NarL family, response regulator YdfI
VIRVLVWTQSLITQAGLEAIVAADDRFQTVPRPMQRWGLLNAAQHAETDVILLDGMELAQAEAASAAQDGLLAPPLVVLADASARTYILRLLHAGVRGILLRDSPPHEITSALQAATDGLAVLSPEILDALFPHGALEEHELLPSEPLTLREAEVLALLAAGASNKEIAARLHISEHTVKFHVSTILGKLRAATRTEAVARGYRQGLILV